MYSRVWWKGLPEYFFKIISDKQMHAEELYSYENNRSIMC